MRCSLDDDTAAGRALVSRLDRHPLDGCRSDGRAQAPRPPEGAALIYLTIVEDSVPGERQRDDGDVVLNRAQTSSRSFAQQSRGRAPDLGGDDATALGLAANGPQRSKPTSRGRSASCRPKRAEDQECGTINSAIRMQFCKNKPATSLQAAKSTSSSDLLTESLDVAPLNPAPERPVSIFHPEHCRSPASKADASIT